MGAKVGKNYGCYNVTYLCIRISDIHICVYVCNRIYTHIWTYMRMSPYLSIKGKNEENDNSSRRQRRRIALFWWWQRKQKNKTTVLITSKSSKKSDPLLSFCIFAVNIDMHEVQILRSPVTGSEYHIRLTVWYGWRDLHRFTHQTEWHRKCRSSTWNETKWNKTFK